MERILSESDQEIGDPERDLAGCKRRGGIWRAARGAHLVARPPGFGDGRHEHIGRGGASHKEANFELKSAMAALAIHAGPLQRLSRLLRSAKDGNLQQDHIVQELESLNKEIRGIGERLRQEAIGDVYFFYSEGDIKLELTHPMHEVLYELSK